MFEKTTWKIVSKLYRDVSMKLGNDARYSLLWEFFFEK